MHIDYSKIEKMLDWMKLKLKFDANAVSAKHRIVKRGQVYRCNFGCGIGSEMNKERPAVVVQNNIGNLHSGNTIVIPITHDDSSLPCVANITPQEDLNGVVILDGQANASNMLCVSKARLGSLIGVLSNQEMKQIDEAIAKAVGIMSYYSDLSKKLMNREAYIEKIKLERNHAQDRLKNMYEILGLEETDSLENYIINLKKSIDSSSVN